MLEGLLCALEASEFASKDIVVLWTSFLGSLVKSAAPELDGGVIGGEVTEASSLSTFVCVVPVGLGAERISVVVVSGRSDFEPVDVSNGPGVADLDATRGVSLEPLSRLLSD